MIFAGSAHLAAIRTLDDAGPRAAILTGLGRRGGDGRRVGSECEGGVMTWIVVLAVGAGSFLFRVGPLLAFQRVSFSARAERLIRYAGTAALTALIAVSTRRTAVGTATVPAVLAVALGVVLAARGASMARVLLAGGALYAVATLAVDFLVR